MKKNKKRAQARKKALLILILFFIAGSILWLLGQDMTTKSDLTGVKGEPTNTVTIQDFSFSPFRIKVKAGTTVTWTNLESSFHTITADTPSRYAPNSPQLGQNESFSFKFDKPGIYSYHCSIHSQMNGAVIVY